MEDLPFWLSLAKAQNGAVLELGCGTGRIFLPLLQSQTAAGQLLVGLDSDADMLHFLKERLPEKAAETVLLIQMDMSVFRFGTRFSLILLPCNTYSTLTGEERRATLAHAYAHLKPGGLLAVSVPNPAALTYLPAYGEPELEETFEHPIDGLPVQVSSYWEKDAASFNLYWQYNHLRSDGSVEEITTRTQHKIVPVQDYLDELQTAGFSRTTIYGDFDHSPYTEQSPTLILLAQSEG
jgi:SAM-dependent methyltransferase